MLKIKDNVDLKELKKFGFIDFTRNEYRPNSTVIYDNERKIHLILYSNPSRLPLEMFDENVIKAYIDDLIKADLVEKVED